MHIIDYNDIGQCRLYVFLKLIQTSVSTDLYFTFLSEETDPEDEEKEVSMDPEKTLTCLQLAPRYFLKTNI